MVLALYAKNEKLRGAMQMLKKIKIRTSHPARAAYFTKALVEAVEPHREQGHPQMRQAVRA